MAPADIERPRFARSYLRVAGEIEERGAREHRVRLLDGIAGEVVEVGAGPGLTFGLYPPQVTGLVAVEPEPTLRAEAQAAAPSAPIPVEVIAGTAEELPLADASADAVVVSLVLCSAGDQARALAEIRRVLRPGGELRFYEHVVPRRGAGRLLAKAADGVGIWPLLAGGCHLARDTERAIAEAGFEIESAERFGFAPMRLNPPIPHLIGLARAPS
ncbi:class I SAM-dependent methyltransferase [Thermoleophilia bacterium SCSIO 60948]|nr:class I SAM-dependent methyltransferase [Thermoleophilia bacterium SCSIO 60948]